MNARQFETRHLLRDERIEHLVRALDIDGNAAYPAGAFFADSVAIALAIRLLGLNEAEEERPARLSNEQLRRVTEYIDAHLHQPLTLDVLSRIAGASSSHLRSWFKASTGSTVHRYVLLRRVERARSLLIQGKLSTDEIAHQTGFAHQSHLAHWIRRETGQTPRSLRRSHLPR
jgi:AraC family transcriptional regulator